MKSIRYDQNLMFRAKALQKLMKGLETSKAVKEPKF